MRVAFLGNDVWSLPPLRALAAAPDIQVQLVLTNPPRPAGRGSELTPTAVADAARTLELPLLEAERVRDGAGFDALDSLEPDAIVVVAYGEILTPDVLDIPRLGAVNVHFSVLPRWRGAAPVQRAILEGDETTGVTVMLMDEGMDTGPILASRRDGDRSRGGRGNARRAAGGDRRRRCSSRRSVGWTRDRGAAIAGPHCRHVRAQAPARGADDRLGVSRPTRSSGGCARSHPIRAR